MVVIAVSQAGNEHDAGSPAGIEAAAHTDTGGISGDFPAKRGFLVKLLVAAGIAIAGWLLAGAFGGATASADDCQCETGHALTQPQRESDSDQDSNEQKQQGLVGTLTGNVVDPLVTTVTGVTGTVTSALPKPLGATVQQTLTTVTGTVTAVTDQVAATTDAIVAPVAGKLVQPIVDKVVAPATDAVVTPVTNTLSPHRGTTDPGTGSGTPARQVAPSVPASSPPATPAEPAAHQTAPARAEQATVVVKAGANRPAPAKTASQPDNAAEYSTVHATGQDNLPAPAPGLPGSQLANFVPTQDNGSNTKSPLGAIGAVTGAPQLTPAGLSIGHALDDNSREAALPTTSPD